MLDVAAVVVPEWLYVQCGAASKKQLSNMVEIAAAVAKKQSRNARERGASGARVVVLCALLALLSLDVECGVATKWWEGRWYEMERGEKRGRRCLLFLICSCWTDFRP